MMNLIVAFHSIVNMPNKFNILMLVGCMAWLLGLKCQKMCVLCMEIPLPPLPLRRISLHAKPLSLFF
jgi:hypothetical protein